MKKTLQTIKKAGMYSAFFGISLMSAQTTYTFTNAGATGRFGPTTPQINAAYLATTLNGLVTQSLGIQSWTVPVTGSYRINSYAASGGTHNNGTLGGLGARTQGDFTLTAGTVLKIVVGQPGQNGTGTANAGGGGGGATYVWNNASLLFPLIASGAGGGGWTTPSDGQIGTSGANPPFGPGGGVGGTLGNPGTGDGTGSCGGAGGAGWLGSAPFCSCIGSETQPVAGQGLAGNFAGGGMGHTYGAAGGFGGGGGTVHGGGGGAGYSGGGGGANSSSAGGGGGSYNAGTNQINTAGVNSGMGRVIITSLFSVNISQTATISCNSYSTAVLSSTVSGGVAPYTYSWVPSGGTASVTTGIPAGTYTCFVLDAGFNFTSSTFTVTQPTAVIASVASQSNVTCYGSNNGAITLTTTTGGTAPYSYTWTPIGGNTVTATGLVANVYSCIVKDANNCSATSAPTATITQPAAFINASSSNSIICAGETATLTATGATSYTWSTGATSPAIVISPSVTTTYTVTGLLAGCTNSLTGTQTVNACTGINEITASLISVYPNPNNGIVNITLTAALAQNSTLEIYDALGKLVVKQVLAKELNTINMSNLDNGIYVFKVLNNNNTVKIGKLIKQ